MKFDRLIPVESKNYPVSLDKEVVLMMDSLGVRNNVSRWYVEHDLALIKINYLLTSTPQGTALIFDVLKNSTVIATVEIEAGGVKGTVVPTQLLIAKDDIISINIRQVGSVYAGSGLQVQILYKTKQ